MRLWVIAERKSDPYYDLIDDFDLIVSSFQSQYGIRLSKELPTGMKWDEFRDLLVGISPDTALGRIVSIRAENDQKVIDQFNEDQKRIWSEWRQKRAASIPQEEADKAIEAFRQTFLRAAGLNLAAVEGMETY